MKTNNFFYKILIKNSNFKCKKKKNSERALDLFLGILTTTLSADTIPVEYSATNDSATD